MYNIEKKCQLKSWKLWRRNLIFFGEFRQKNRERARDYYHNVFKADPEKHRKYIEKCYEPKIIIKTEEDKENLKQ